MGAQIREYRQRIRSVSATKKITRAMELMAASRVVKAQQAVRESSPYARAITRAVSAVATYSSEDHPLIGEKEHVKRAGVVIMTSDRGLAGAYSSSVLKESERLIARLRDEEGKEVVPYLMGRKAVGYYKFRGRDYAEEWSGFSEKPTFNVAREVGERLVADFTTATDEGGVDEVHVVFTRFVSMVTQEPEVIRLLQAKGKSYTLAALLAEPPGVIERDVEAHPHLRCDAPRRDGLQREAARPDEEGHHHQETVGPDHRGTSQPYRLGPANEFGALPTPGPVP